MPAIIKVDLLTDKSVKRLDGDEVIRALEGFLDLVRGICHEDVNGNDFQWYFSELAVGSLRAVGVGELRDSAGDGGERERKIENLCMDGVALLGRRPQTPIGFTAQSLRGMETLTRAFENGVTAIRIGPPQLRRRARVDKRVVANLKKLLGRGFTDLGSIEGRLVTVSLARYCAFNISDEATGAVVQCRFDEDRLNEVKEALGRRVSVTGEVTYHRDGVPTEISPINTISLLDETPAPTLDHVRQLIHPQRNRE